VYWSSSSRKSRRTKAHTTFWKKSEIRCKRAMMAALAVPSSWTIQWSANASQTTRSQTCLISDSRQSACSFATRTEELALLKNADQDVDVGRVVVQLEPRHVGLHTLH